MGVVVGVSVPLRIAASATAVSFLIGVWLAWLLVNRQFPGRRELGVLSTAALALPAPVICYSLLFDRQRAWSWGMTAAGVLAATPMVVRAGRMALASLDCIYGNIGRSLGKSDWRVFWRLELPLVWRSLAGAAVVAFVRILGESLAAFVIAAQLGR
ncbi:MAG TPA: ABC transporter permease subunit [Bryobacteraceae bacterium]|nr:ABC transporter permease subunit [Bryobacteraceae bacterium]